MGESLERSGTDCITVAVRRERLIDAAGNNLLDFIDTSRYTLLPNTAGCFNADDAVRVARLGREILLGLENPGADWVKLEVLGDKKTLLPDPVATLEATEQLVADGFQVLCYTTDDPITARRLKEAGATSVMPAGSPIGSGQGVLNPNNIRICLEYLKEGDPDYPVIVDAGVGTASDVTIAMELGVDGVLLNTGIAHAKDPLRMADAMRHADRSRPAGVPLRAASEAALRHGQQPGRRRSYISSLADVMTYWRTAEDIGSGRQRRLIEPQSPGNDIATSARSRSGFVEGLDRVDLACGRPRLHVARIRTVIRQ